MGNNPLFYIDPSGLCAVEPGSNQNSKNKKFDLYDALNKLDQTLAGFADSATGGLTTKARESLYGDLAARNHDGGWFTGGQIAGEIASTFAPASKLKWFNKLQDGIETLSTLSDVYDSTKNIINGEGDWTDALTIVGSSLDGLGSFKKKNNLDVDNNFGINSNNVDPSTPVGRRGDHLQVVPPSNIKNENRGKIV